MPLPNVGKEDPNHMNINYDDPDFKLHAMDWFLNITLKKDLSYKFHNEDPKFGVAYPDLAPENHWRVAGAYDFLNVKRLKVLEEIKTTECENNPWSDIRCLLLFPFEGLGPDDELISMLECPDNNTLSSDRIPIMVMSRLLLAPPVYELRNKPGTVTKSIWNLIRLCEKKRKSIGNLKTIYFGSLSGPDLVIITLPTTPEELAWTHTLHNMIGSLKLAELKNGDYFTCENRANLEMSKCPGHALVSLTPLLTFREKSKDYFALENFKNAELKYGLKLPFRLRVDCGHEQRVMSEMQSLCSGIHFDEFPPSKSPSMQWDSYVISGYFDHLDTLVNVWEKLWSNKPWRKANLLDSITIISMCTECQNENDGNDGIEKVWEINKETIADLQNIKTKFDRFSKEFLNSTQKTELDNIYNCFYSCFFRQDLLGTARDLFPFFRQLGNALGEIDKWNEYLQAKDVDRVTALEISNAFGLSIEDLFPHVSRAVQNRIEHRLKLGDLPIPQTLRDGACKIISAYTAVVYLCWEVFRRSDKDKEWPWVRADHFAVCVRAGMNGRVVCDELFRDFRAFNENGRLDRPHVVSNLLSNQSDLNKWSSRLLLFDISGQSMLRPEESVVHCLHECAELSDWIQLDKCARLRWNLNRWVIAEVVGIFRHSLALAALDIPHCLVGSLEKEKKDELAEVDKNLKPLAANYVPYALTAYQFEYLEKRGIGTLQYTEILPYFQDVLINQHPINFVQQLIDSIYFIGSRNIKTLAGITSGDSSGVLDLFYNTFPADVDQKELRSPDASLIPQVSIKEDLQISLETFKDFATEVIADVGMWCAFDNIMGENRPSNFEQRFYHLKKIFRSIFILSSETSGASGISERLRHTILRRYAVQVAAICDAEVDWRKEIYSSLADLGEEIIGTHIKQYLKETLSAATQFDPQKGLVSKLKQFNSYGGKDPLCFPDVWGQHNSILEAFVEAWSKESVSSRIHLLHSLWAMSTRFDRLSLLDVRELKNKK